MKSLLKFLIEKGKFWKWEKRKKKFSISADDSRRKSARKRRKKFADEGKMSSTVMRWLARVFSRFDFWWLPLTWSEMNNRTTRIPFLMFFDAPFIVKKFSEGIFQQNSATKREKSIKQIKGAGDLMKNSARGERKRFHDALSHQTFSLKIKSERRVELMKKVFRNTLFAFLFLYGDRTKRMLQSWRLEFQTF